MLPDRDTETLRCLGFDKAGLRYVAVSRCRDAAMPKSRDIMNVLTIASQKGGTGKSTLAINLGVLAEAAMGPVAIVDCDEHRGLARWRLQRAADRPIVAELPERGGVEEILARCREAGARLVLLDTPAGTPAPGSVIVEAIAAADLVVMASKAGFLDIMAARPTVEAIGRAGRRGVVVLNDVPSRSAVVEGARTALAGYGLPVCPTAIAHRVGISYSLLTGQSLAEYDARNPGVGEFEQVWQWLSGRLDHVA
jgi:chromosome partitioning protein